MLYGSFEIAMRVSEMVLLEEERKRLFTSDDVSFLRLSSYSRPVENLVSPQILLGLPNLSWIVWISSMQMWEIIGHLISPRRLEQM